MKTLKFRSVAMKKKSNLLTRLNEKLFFFVFNLNIFFKFFANFKKSTILDEESIIIFII